MGCDIHIVLEVKSDEPDKWVGVRWYGSFDSRLIGRDDTAWCRFRLCDRDYSFFNALCGVRGEGSEFGYEPRGLPDDASDMSIHYLEEDGDLHSHSWLDMRELSGPLAAHKGSAKHVMQRMANPACIELLHIYVDDSIEEDNVGAYRLVFAFDN